MSGANLPALLQKQAAFFFNVRRTNGADEFSLAIAVAGFIGAPQPVGAHADLDFLVQRPADTVQLEYQIIVERLRIDQIQQLAEIVSFSRAVEPLVLLFDRVAKRPDKWRQSFGRRVTL